MTSATTTPSDASRLASAEVLHIAETDALRAYRDLSPFRITLVLEPDGWHVDYELKNSDWNGGGPHYVIDAVSGTILQKRYEQ